MTNSIMKKITSLIVALIMVFGFTPIVATTAFAEVTGTVDRASAPTVTVGATEVYTRVAPRFYKFIAPNTATYTISTSDSAANPNTDTFSNIYEGENTEPLAGDVNDDYMGHVSYTASLTKDTVYYIEVQNCSYDDQTCMLNISADLATSDFTGTITTSESWSKTLNEIFPSATCPDAFDAVNILCRDLGTVPTGGDTSSVDIRLNGGTYNNVDFKAGETECSGNETITFTATTAGTYSFNVISQGGTNGYTKSVQITVTGGDTTAPILSGASASGTSDTQTTLNFTSDEAGTYYYLVYAAADTAPNAATIEAQGTAVAKGTNTATASSNTASVTGLSASTAYKAYVIVKDAAGNVSDVTTITFTTTATPDTTAPILSLASASGTSDTQTTLNFTSDEAGTYYYLVYASADTAPNAATVEAQGTAVAKGTSTATASANTADVTGLSASTAYKAYVIVKDAAGNVSDVTTIEITTTATPDTTAPILSLASASGTSDTQTTLNFTSDEAGTYYYLVYAAADTAPIAATVEAQGTAVAKGTNTAAASSNTASVTGLSASTAYKAYVIVKDAAGNVSDVTTISFTTTAAPDTTAPILSGASASGTSDTQTTLNFTSDEAGTYYYLVYAAADGEPNAATVEAQGTAVAKGTGTATASANTASVTGLSASTAYKAYVIVKDAAGNVSDVTTIEITTTATPDTTAPILSSASASGTSDTQTTLNFTSDEAGTYYYLVYAAADTAPNAATVEAQGTAVAKGTGTATASANTASVTGLSASTAYKAYVIVKDAAGNVSDVTTISFTTTDAPDTTAPILSSASASGTSDTQTTLNFTSDEAGTYYYLVYAAADTAPNAATIEAQGTAVAKGTSTATASSNTASVTGLSASTAYKAYVIVKDAAGNVSDVTTIEITTTATPDTTAPILSSASASGTSDTQTTLNFTSDEAGTYYYLVYGSGDTAPNAATVEAQGTAVAKGTNTAAASSNTASVTGLSASTAYKAYVIVKDAAGNVSVVSTISFTTTATPDTTAPILSSASASGTSDTQTTLNFTSDEAGTYYYLVYAAADTAPNAATVEAQGTAVAKGTSTATASANTADVTGLAASTAYKAYVIVKDAAGNVSDVTTIEITTTATPDTTAPILSVASASGTSDTGTTLNFTSDEAGTYYYVVYGSADTAPNAATVEAQGTAVAKGTNTAAASVNTADVTGLAASTAYKAYVIVKDAAGNVSDVTTIEITTTATPDTTAPILSSASASGTSDTQTTLNFTSDEAGTYYYLVYASADTAPNAATVEAQGTAVAKGTNTAAASANTVSVTGLSASTAYKAYVIVKDTSGNLSDVTTITFTTTDAPDTTKPVLTAGTVTRTSDTAGTVKFTSNESGRYYYAVVADGASIPTIDTNGVGTVCTALENTITNPAGLTAGAKDIYIKVKDEAGNTSDVLKIDIAAYVSTGGGSSGGGGGGTSTKPSEDKVIVIVNGKEHNAGTETKTTENGKIAVTVKVDNKAIETKIQEAVKNNPTGTNNVVQVPVSDTKSDITRVELTGDIVKRLEDKTFDVSVKRDNIEYVIPAQEFTISKVAQSLGLQEKDLKDIKVEVEITKLDEKVVAKYNEVAKSNGAELIFPPVAFEVVAKTTKTEGKSETVDISKFNNYVERVMELPAGVDASKITTGIVFNPDGTYNHVPTEIFKKNSKWYAKLNSLTNSNYSVVWNPITVKTVENHWAKDSVNDMAARLVVFNPNSFNPNKAITRADFAEYIVRALGVYREDSSHENKFNDVSANGDRTRAILIANEYGIVTGYTDGTFKPDELITREEAMSMYQRAMKITKLVGSDTNRYQNYTDFAKVSSWAKSNVKEVLAAHIFNGTGTTNISPKSNLTYAEAAQAIKNLLVESKLINK